MRRLVLVLCLLGLLVVTPGCLKMSMQFHILPDGSGKVTQSFASMPFEQMKPFLMKMGIPEEMLKEEDFNQNQEDPMADLKDLPGVVWEEPVESVGEDGWTYTTVVGYFEDINALEPEAADGEQSDTPLTGLRFEAFEDGHKLTMPGDKGEEGGDEEQPGDPAMEAMMMEMMKTMEFKVEFHMPGAIKSVTEVRIDDEHVMFGQRSERSAGILLTGEMLDPKNEPKFEDDVSIVSGPADDAALADLKAEVADALQRLGAE